MYKLCLLVFAAATLSAQKPLSKEEQILIRLAKIEEQNHRILKILEEADAPPPPVKIDVSMAPTLGKPDAPVTIVEFTDYECPYCSKFHTDIFPALHAKLIATGKVQFVSRDFPLPMHKGAKPAAEAGRCAQEQGRFWEMRDYLQSNPTKLTAEVFHDEAVDLGLNMEQFDNCVKIEKYKEEIEKNIKEAEAIGIQATPSFLIGKSGSVVQGELIRGALPLDAFEQAILRVK